MCVILAATAAVSKGRLQNTLHRTGGGLYLSMPNETNANTDSVMQQFSVLGVRIHNVTSRQAIAAIEELIDHRDDRASSVFFVNAHTLNLAAADPSYRAVLNARRFRLRRRHRRPLGSPAPRRSRAGKPAGHRLDPVAVPVHRRSRTFVLPARRRCRDDRSWPPNYAQRTFPGWRLVGLSSRLPDRRRDGSRPSIDKINAAKPDVLLVGMGNPLQEQWIHRHLPELRVPRVHGRRRSVRLLGRQRQPLARLAATAGPRMALAAFSGAAPESPPLPGRQSAVPRCGFWQTRCSRAQLDSKPARLRHLPYSFLTPSFQHSIIRHGSCCWEYLPARPLVPS